MTLNVRLLLAAGLILLPLSGIAAPECVSSNRPFRVQVRELGVSAEPWPLAGILTTLTYKTAVTITATNGDWYQLGKSGWVHKSGVTQRSLESLTGSVEEFSAIVSGIVTYLTNGVGNTPSNAGATTAPPSGARASPSTEGAGH